MSVGTSERERQVSQVAGILNRWRQDPPHAPARDVAEVVVDTLSGFSPHGCAPADSAWGTKGDRHQAENSAIADYARRLAATLADLHGNGASYDQRWLNVTAAGGFEAVEAILLADASRHSRMAGKGTA